VRTQKMTGILIKLSQAYDGNTTSRCGAEAITVPSKDRLKYDPRHYVQPHPLLSLQALR
jgi:hypothetical protein